jgi:two-component system response regulator AgrA
MINVIICDDNDKDRNNVKNIAEEFMKKNKKDFKIFTFNDYNKSFYAVAEAKMPFKIYLLDIETPSKSGIDVAREIRRKDINSVIIFLTAHEELGNIVLKNDLLFLSFINKFDDFQNRLNSSLEKSLDLLSKKNVIRFEDRNTLYTININDILYITKESFERKTVIVTDYGEFKVSKPMHEIISMLDDRFTQTHRACYINDDRKIKIDRAKRLIMFDTGKTIDLLSDKYKKEVV